MKRKWTLLISLMVVLLVVQDAATARGPGGGGGSRGGGGGASRSGGGAARAPSASAGRSPSVSGGARPSAAPAARPGAGAARPSAGAVGAGQVGAGGGAARPAMGAGAGAGRPSAGQVNDFLNVPRPTTGAGGATAAARSGGAAGDFLQQGGVRPATGGPVAGAAGAARPGVNAAAGVGAAGLGAAGAAAAGQRGNLADNRPSRVENRQELQDNRQSRRDEVRNQVHENNPRLDFWSDHPNWASWRINAPYRWATWAALGGWIGYGTSEPAYYDYGSNVYYQDDQVYQDGQPVATADQYAEQAAAIAESAPKIEPSAAEWLPLGVFALTQDGQATGAAPTLFMQLAVSKESVISGTFTNSATNQTQMLEGMVDVKSQRAAWGVAGQQRPIMETGLANLTKDESPALIHFADGSTQQWLMVRLNEPPQQ